MYEENEVEAEAILEDLSPSPLQIFGFGVLTQSKCSINNKKLKERSIEEREEVILNDDGQPIGPREKTVKDLSLFLGTMARNSTFCPLTYTNWKALPSDLKDHMWKYINAKFNVPDEGKKWVESTIQDAWRRYKCKIKRLHFEKFANMTERLKHRPATISESHFKKLCLYWNHLTQNPEQNHTEAFKEVFGKEKAGRVCCYGRNVTPTALKQKEKQNQIMDSMKQEHAKEVNSLKSELQDVKQQMLGMQSFIKVWMQQNNSGMNMENLDVFFRSFPSEANNAQNDEGQCNEHSTTHASNPDKKEREAYEVHVKCARLTYRQSQELVHTKEESKWIFVLSTTRTLNIREKKKGLFQHSSLTLACGATIAS
ncbi:putative transposase [Senna tora]|uniref:Putative transposase n=1 Tax=Senna tora TaxID=362788 RepID=A0A834TPH9_9FABA|nr:putative transposase [Senna tora]